jgi:hypothetical protein
MIGMLVAPLIVGVGHHNMRLLPADEADKCPHRFFKRGGGKGARVTAGWHIRIPVAEHPDSLIAKMCCCRG